jgi:hypothetical protein
MRGAVEFWEANGPMIRALEEASWHDDHLRAAFQDEIGLRLIMKTTEAILRDQAKVWIGPMDPREMSAALNRFTMTYLNDRFGNSRRKGKPNDKETAIEGPRARADRDALWESPKPKAETSYEIASVA